MQGGIREPSLDASVARLEHEIVAESLAVCDDLVLRITEYGQGETSACGIHFPIPPAIAALAGWGEGAKSLPLITIGGSGAVIPEGEEFGGFVEGDLHASFADIGLGGDVLGDVVEVIGDADEVESTAWSGAVKLKVHAVEWICGVGDHHADTHILAFAGGVAHIEDDLPVFVVPGAVVPECEDTVVVIAGAHGGVVHAT